MDVEQFLAGQPPDCQGDSGGSENAPPTASISKQLSLIRSKAIALLARREHSFQEMEQKLSRQFSETSLVLEILQALTEEGLLSDQRFTAISIRSGLAKFYGPNRIKNDLRSKGISEGLIQQELAEQEPDWVEHLQKLSAKKYRCSPCLDQKEKSKRIRFFQYRGYDLSDIFQVLGSNR